jgi:hypothetical protein
VDSGFDRRGKLDVMRPGWGSGTLGSRNPVAVLVGTDGWGLFVVSPWVQVDLRDPARIARPFRPSSKTSKNRRLPASHQVSTSNDRRQDSNRAIKRSSF